MNEAIQETISIECELPVKVYESLQRYLDQNKDWTHDRFMAAAASLFLLQNGDCDRAAARAYLDTLFGRAA